MNITWQPAKYYKDTDIVLDSLYRKSEQAAFLTYIWEEEGELAAWDIDSDYDLKNLHKNVKDYWTPVLGRKWICGKLAYENPTIPKTFAEFKSMYPVPT